MILYPKYFHIGVPKSGSTTLQYILEQDDRINLIFKPRYFNTSKWWTEAYQYCDAQKEYNIESDESLLRQFRDHCKMTTTLARIKSVRPDAEFIIVQREQRSLLRSRYKHGVRHGLSVDFATWLCSGQGMDFLSLSLYADLFRVLNSFFPKEQIHFLLFERLQNDFKKFYSDVYDILKLSPPEFAVRDNVQKNEGWTDPQLYVKRILNRYRVFKGTSGISDPFRLRDHQAKSPGLGRILENKIHRTIIQLFKAHYSGKPLAEWTDNEFFKGIQDGWKISNQDLVQLGLFTEDDLASNGYLI